ncbi:CDP-glycerol glycerophosphotransferase family protein [uncultured Friedmanniella sp.]|uniref:CDP-glycerol glycerophosphotransferase family protein n=1 Tax=uncultured Friedmanniella sp. TaxID=335381 RepID=UPI0035CC618D
MDDIDRSYGAGPGRHDAFPGGPGLLEVLRSGSARLPPACLGVDRFAAMNAGRRGLRLLRSSRWALLVLLGAGAGAIGHHHGWARAVAGLGVAAGLVQQLALLALARYRRRPEEFRVELPMAVALTLAVGVWCAIQRPTQLPGAVALTLVSLAVVGVNRSAHESSLPVLLAAHLAGVDAEPPPPPHRWHPGRLAAGTLSLLVLVVVLATLGARLVHLALVVLVLVVALGVLGSSQRRVRAHQLAVRRALRDLAPVWAMPYNGIAAFHLGMWAPYLQRTGRPVIVVTTMQETFRRVGAAYHLPLICAPDLGPASPSSLFPPSVKAAFYVFNGSNRRFLEVRRVRHVFLQHGDSDKAGSANPFSLRYDHIVVSGQAGIDRFAASGLAVPAHQFVLLGRPQTADIELSTRPVSSARPPVVLYAPTWKGRAERTSYSSLLLGPRIVRTLLGLGAVVVFRPHPAGRNFAPHVRAIKRIRAILRADEAVTGRPHRWGPAAEGVSVAEVVNSSDAMVSDVSGIVTDYLASGKPFAMVSTRHPAEEFRRLFPTSQAAYVIESDLAGLRETLQQMLGPDPLAERRAERRSYYLSERDGREAADAFATWVESLAAEPARDSAGTERRSDTVQRALLHR